MSIADTLKGLIFKKPANSAEPRDPRRSKEPLAGGRRAGEAENPYLAARRTWNDHVGGVVSQRQTWQVIGILSLLIALAGVGGVIHIGSQSKFIPTWSRWTSWARRWPPARCRPQGRPIRVSSTPPLRTG